MIVTRRFFNGAVTTTVTLALMSGCQTLAPDTPARIIDADTASRAEVQEVVNAALGTNVMLADNALTETNVLLVELSPPRSISNQHPQGRTMDLPVRFQLFTDGNSCVLVDERTGTRHSLNKTKCTALRAVTEPT